MALLLIILGACRQGFAQGQWSPVENWPVRAIHTTLLPDGRVLFYSFYTESTQPQIWDPASNTFTPTTPAPYELFCGGNTALPDGRVFISGGHIADYTGFPHVQIYDPSKNTFTALPDMNAGRWYPTNTVLPDGDVLVVSGDINANTAPNPLPQVYQMASNSWRNLTSAQMMMPLYPVMLVAPNGKVFNAGPSRLTRYLDPSGTGTWSAVGNMNFTGSRDYGPGLMYDAGKVLEVGGGDPPTNTAEIIDLTAATPAWKNTGAMHFARRQHNAVILPDGKVLIVGGSSGSGFDNSNTPVLPTEMWDPATGQFTVMASISEYRGYHSTALLLPDGRVLSAGGNVGGPNAQIFSPPYLLGGGARPTISSGPTGANYGQSVLIGTPDAAGITQVTLLHTGSTTHTFDQSQRFMRLAFTQASGGLNVTMPASANLAPPGFYMLFLLNSAGAPSVATIIQIGQNVASSTGTVTGTVTNTSGAPLAGVTVSGGNATAKTATDGTYTLFNVTPGSVTLTASLTGYQSATESVTVSANASAGAAAMQLAPINPGGVTGVVNNSGGTGISGAMVTGGGLAAITSGAGSYTLANVPAGMVTLTASATGFQSASTTVTVTAGTTTTAPAITLSSNNGTVTGTVKSSSGAVIAGASVGFGGGMTTTDSTGTYTLSNLPAGTIQLVASATGFQSSTQNVTVVAGSTTTANFVLAPAASAGTVTGKVTNISTGGVIAGAAVNWSGGSTTANSSGVYTLSNVAGGNQSITAGATGYLPRASTITVTGGATSTLNFQLSTAGKLTAKAVTSAGAAIGGASVTIKGGVIATTVTGTTNSSGLFLSNWIPIGSYTVTVARTGSTTQNKGATVSTGQTTTVTFTF